MKMRLPAHFFTHQFTHRQKVTSDQVVVTHPSW
jgi:hypothetical protein